MNYVSPRKPFAESRTDWLKRVHSQPCPECQPSTYIPANVFQLVKWCPSCEQVWRVTVERIHRQGWTHLWHHEADHATAREVPR